jgi:hypothetical protein
MTFWLGASAGVVLLPVVGAGAVEHPVIILNAIKATTQILNNFFILLSSGWMIGNPLDPFILNVGNKMNPLHRKEKIRDLFFIFLAKL